MLLHLVATSAGLFRVPRALPLNVAREMLLTGDPVSAQRLADLGVVNRVVEPGMTVAEAITLAERIEHNAPTSIRATLTAAGYQASEKHLGGWLHQHFQVTRTGSRTRAFGHASVRQVNHHNTWHWMCIAPKPGAGG